MNLVGYKLINKFQKAFVNIAIPIIGFAIEVASVLDKDVKNECRSFREKFSILFIVKQGPKLLIEKKAKKLKIKKQIVDNANLTVTFKNIYSAFLVFSLQLSFEEAVAEHRVSTKGDTTDGMTLIRCFAKILSYIPMKRG